MDQVPNPLGIPGEFSTQVSTGIPVEIVDPENQNVGRQNTSTEEMDISLGSEQKLASTHLSAMNITSLSGTASVMSTLQSSTNPQLKRTVDLGATAHSATIDQISNTNTLEISADAIPSLSDNLGIESGSASVSMSTPARQMIGKFGIRLSPTSMLNDPSPTTSDDEFDSTDLLNQNLLQHAQDEVTQRLAQAGPVGVAAAAAILSSRKRKRAYGFETNPSVRKRHCSKLTKKLKETIEELTSRVGLQACLVTFRPPKLESKQEALLNVYGAAPLSTIINDLQSSIVTQMNVTLHNQTPQTIQPKPQGGEALHELPSLIFDGIPTPVHKMTQAQLRTFIPVMLKLSTGRGKPGWGKDAVKPQWWPVEVPWANVRSDIRDDAQKKALSWTDALRRIVLSCYLHHGRIDLLPEFTVEHLQQLLSPEAAQQLQQHLETLQQNQQQQATPPQQQSTLAGDILTPVPVGMETAPLEPESDSNQQSATGSNQQVFTVDTGMGNCDTSGMPTLADASLAETASRLQQVADETGEVQYATQTVTVTDRDAKALGQPVGSTTTVLLTAYPGGHNGNNVARSDNTADSTTGTSFLGSQAPTGTGNPPNIQVVYSGSNVEASAATPQESTQSFPTSTTSPIPPTSAALQVSVANEYLTAAASQELLEATSNISTIPNRGDDVSSDLAAQLMNEYAESNSGEFGVKRPRLSEGTGLIGTTSAELVPLDGDTAKNSEA